MAQRIDHQAAFDFLVAATQPFLHRDGHACRIERDPDFAAGDIGVAQEFVEQRGERVVVRRLIEAGCDRERTTEVTAPERPAAHRAVHVKKYLRHDLARHRRRIVEPFEIRPRCQDVRRFDQIEIEIAGTPGNRLMPPAEQEARNREALEQMFALEPRVEFSLTAGTAIVPDGQDAGLLDGPSLFGRHDHDFNLVVGRCEFRLNGGARGRVARRHPGIPYRVHFGEIGHIGDPDIGRQQF